MPSEPKPMDSGRLGRWLLMVLLAATVPGAAAAGPATEWRTPPTTKAVVGEMVSQSAFAYRVGPGAWLIQAPGSFPVALPLEVRTGSGHCKVALEPNWIFEGAPQSEFAVRQSDRKGLTFSLRSGAALYALAEDTTLGIAVAKPELAAVAGEATSAPGARSRSVYSRAAHLGIVRMADPASAEFHNLKGRLAVVQGGEVPRAVNAGQPLSVSGTGGGSLTFSAITPGGGAGVRAGGSGAAGSGIRSVGEWWVFDPTPAGLDATLRPNPVVLSPASPRWPLNFLPPTVRQRMSPWEPPPRRRSYEPENPPATPPWQQPGRRR